MATSSDLIVLRISQHFFVLFFRSWSSLFRGVHSLEVLMVDWNVRGSERMNMFDQRGGELHFHDYFKECIGVWAKLKETVAREEGPVSWPVFFGGLDL